MLRGVEVQQVRYRVWTTDGRNSFVVGLDGLHPLIGGLVEAGYVDDPAAGFGLGIVVEVV